MNKLFFAKLSAVILTSVCVHACTALVAPGKAANGFPTAGALECVNSKENRLKNPKFAARFKDTFCNGAATTGWPIDQILKDILQSPDVKADNAILVKIAKAMLEDRYAHAPFELLAGIDAQRHNLAIFKLRNDTINQRNLTDAEKTESKCYMDFSHGTAFKFLKALKKYLEDNKLTTTSEYSSIYNLTCADQGTGAVKTKKEGRGSSPAKDHAASIEAEINSRLKQAGSVLTDAQLAAGARDFLSDCANSFACAYKLYTRNISLMTHESANFQSTASVCDAILTGK